MPRMLIVSTVAVTQRVFLLPFAEHFRRLGWEVDGMAAGVASCPVCSTAFSNVYDIDWSRNPMNPSNLTNAVARVRQVVSQRQYHIVHVHTPVASFVVRYALRNWSRHHKESVIVYTAHGFHFHKGGQPLKNAAFLTLEKLAGRWTDHLVVINREDEAAAVKYGLVRHEQVHYMPGIGIDLTNYWTAKNDPDVFAEIRSDLGIVQGQRLLLMIASFDPEKRHCDVLQAISMLRRQDFILAFAGIGPLQQRCIQLANSLGIEQKVRFLGFRKDIPTLLKMSLATILPSEREGLPRSVMESMASGVPVIGTDTRGIRDLLAGGGGLVVPIGAPDTLAQAMAYLLDEPARAKQMGEQGKSSVQQYDIKHILRLHENLYARALSLTELIV
jgi:glycosyltransferase involved in cell wall biosynthesis